MGSPCPHDRCLVADAGPDPHPAAAAATAPITVTTVRLAPPDARAAAGGVVAFAEIEVAGAIKIWAAVLRDLRGQILVRLPTRCDRSGRRHPQVAVLSTELRDRIDDAVALAVLAAGATGGVQARVVRDLGRATSRSSGQTTGQSATRPTARSATRHDQTTTTSAQEGSQ